MYIFLSLILPQELVRIDCSFWQSLEQGLRRVSLYCSFSLARDCRNSLLSIIIRAIKQPVQIKYLSENNKTFHRRYLIWQSYRETEIIRPSLVSKLERRQKWNLKEIKTIGKRNKNRVMKKIPFVPSMLMKGNFCFMLKFRDRLYMK